MIYYCKMKKKITIGEKVSIRKAFNEYDVRSYAILSGDTNPIHLNEDFAKSTPFGSTIVHGILVGSLFGGLLGSKLPGKGTIHLGQTMYFKRPIYVNEEVLAEIEVVKIREDKPIITMRTIVYNSKNEIAIEGEAVIKISNK